MEELLQVGVITSTHGVRGEVKVYPTTDDATRFKQLKHVLLDTGKETLPLEIQGVKFFKQFVILKFKGIDNINDIEKYKPTLREIFDSQVKPSEDYIYDVAETKAYDLYDNGHFDEDPYWD